MLKELGYAPHTVGNAADALAAIEQQTFDLVVSDIVMAGEMDGLALARAIGESRPRLPVLLMTGYSQVVDEATHEFTILRKPFEISELSRICARIMAGAKQPASANLVRLSDARRAASKSAGQ